MAFGKRASALDIASALAGGAFFSVTVFFLIGAAVWAVLTLAHAPLPAITAAEALAGLAAVAIGVATVRNGIKVATQDAL
jgi:ABC-type branched-subunit amino acid transport system permease subunit